MFAIGLDLQLVGDRLSLHATNTPLREILESFTRFGVTVYWDPAVDKVVSGKVMDEPVEAALRRLLDPLGYVFVWQVLETPVGTMPQLTEIRVFQPGKPENLLRIGKEENFATATGPDPRGPLFVPEEILIGFRRGSSRDDILRLIREIGGSVVGCASNIGVYRIRLPHGANVPDWVTQLNRHPLVARAEPNYILEQIGPRYVREHGGVALPDAPVVTQLQYAVAVLDSGLTRLDALSKVVAASWDAIQPDAQIRDPVGHGTQMALIASGLVAPEQFPLRATVPPVPIVAVRAFDAQGHSTSFALITALEFAVNQGARVINLSWGTSTYSEFLDAALQDVVKRNVAVVAAAGNTPNAGPIYPAAFPGVIAVSAVNPDGTIWENSNSGKFVMFAAPGSADFPVGYRGPPGTYVGTSIASAYVSYLLGVYLQTHTNATPRDAVSTLQRIARDAGPPGWDPAYGYGILDSSTLERILQQK